MLAGVIAESSDVRETLGWICARNVAVEIHYGDSTDDVRTARVRLLTLEEDVICTDKPQNVCTGVELHSGQRITVFFTQDNARWAFDSCVRKLNRIVRLNARHRVVGMAIAVPTELKLLQRRRDYRVSLASVGIDCAVALESTEHEHACDLKAKVLRGTISNLSSRGAAVVIDSVSSRQFPFGRHVFLAFRLPEHEEEFLLRAEVRHAREVRGRGNVVVGVRLLAMPLCDMKAVRSTLARFVAEEQRRKLRRRR